MKTVRQIMKIYTPGSLLENEAQRHVTQYVVITNEGKERKYT